jgi:NDP-sugar pyrophosphorylase family protein
MVLTAGLGTRLHPLTMVRAKPALPVAGESMARRIVLWLVENGAADITLNLHHLPHTLTSVVGDGSDLGARVRYSWEPVLLGSAGGPRQALDIIGAETFFLINGDTLTDARLSTLWSAHADAGALVTPALVPNVEPLRYGGVRLADDGAVVGFARRGPSAVGSFHFIGVQVASREAFANLVGGQPARSIGGLYDRLLADRPGSVRGCVVPGQFWDVGTPVDYWKTSRALSAAGVCPQGADTRLAASAAISESILWDRVTVGESAVLDRCIVTDGVDVPARAVYRRAILVRAADGRTQATAFTTD